MALRTQDDIRDLKKDGNPESLSLKLFAHHINVGGKTNSIFEDNAYTVLYIEGFEVIDVVAASQSIETTIVSEANRIDGTKQKLEQTSSFTVQGSRNIQKFFTKNIVLFTIGEQLDVDKYKRGEQELFISKETLPSQINQKLQNNALFDRMEYFDGMENITNYTLVNIHEVNQLANSSILPTYSKRVVDPTSISIKHDKSFLRTKILAKGKIDNKFTDIDLKVKSSSTLSGLIKATPISTINKLTIFSDSLDLNITLPFERAKMYIKPAGLRNNFITGNADPKWKIELWKLFLSILELTKAFSNNFSEYTIKNDKTGKLEVDPNEKIGGYKLGLLPSTTDAKTAINGRIENWKLTYPQFVEKNEFKLFKIFVLMLTPFIQSEYSLGGGLNQAHRLYKLWYFDLRTTITKGIANSASNDIEVQLKSEFYDFNNGSLELKDKFKELSTYKALDISGWASLAELPNALQSINKFSKPGDINPNSEDLSKYYVYIPVDDIDKLEELYGKTSTQNKIGLHEAIKSGYETQKSSATTSKSHSKPRPPEPPAVKMDALEVYAKYVKNRLSSNQSMKFINNEPDIRNIEIKRIDHITMIHTNHPNLRPYDPAKRYWAETIDTYSINFEYTVIENGHFTEVLMSSEKAVQDKESMLDLAKYLYSKSSKVIIDAELLARNKASKINEINQIILKGMFGNEFDIEIFGKDKDGNQARLILQDIEFTSKFDETQTTTKVNL